MVDCLNNAGQIHLGRMSSFSSALIRGRACAALLVYSAAAATWAGDMPNHLTISGAEKAGNKDGSIPAWTAPENQSQAGWSYGKSRQNFWIHKNDKPLFTIDASNVDKYAAMLSPGQLALVKLTPKFGMSVYPSRRSCGVPDFVADNTRKNIDFAKISSDGWSIQDAMVPGFPFPQPKSGVEAMWNMKMRYKGIAMDNIGATTFVSPRRGSDEWIRAESDQTQFYPWGGKGSRKLSEVGQTEYQTYFAFRAPAALAGQAAIITTSLSVPGGESFYYFPGQRRVRRLPTYAYDAPQIGFENQYLIDETTMFQGTLDRFDWKLIGKKELIVPSNSFGAYDFTAKPEAVVQQEGLTPDHKRYELHRVWVIEATVKSGSRHVSPKRTYYLDEDSWNAVLAEDYDAQGKIWKVREGYQIPVYETGTCDVQAFAQYNLVEGRMLLDFNQVGAGKDARWSVEPTSPRHKTQFYSSDNLRAISER
jgi:hypothetical protein